MRFDYDTTDPVGSAAMLGVIVLQSDETLENDLRRLFPQTDVALHVSRVPSATEVTSATLSEMAHHLTGAAALFPHASRFDAVGYGCTSGASVIGPARVAQLVKEGCATQAVTDPVSALVAACGHLGIGRLALLSPYVEEVSATLRRVLAEGGVATPVFGSFEEAREERVARIAPDSLIAAATALAGAGGIDGIFMSCTNLRTLDVIDTIEAQTGLPVLSSNLVFAWHLARLAGTAPGRRIGRLMQ
ncbi:MAG: aspartate/glutamate racemase family protein [Pararhodobacter sp.]